MPGTLSPGFRVLSLHRRPLLGGLKAFPKAPGSTRGFMIIVFTLQSTYDFAPPHPFCVFVCLCFEKLVLLLPFGQTGVRGRFSEALIPTPGRV